MTHALSAWTMYSICMIKHKAISLLIALALLTATVAVISPASATGTNKPNYWGSDCVKVDNGTGSDSLTLTANYRLVVLKSGRANDLFWGVTSGTTVSTVSGKDISHYILCGKDTPSTTTTLPPTTTTEAPPTTTTEVPPTTTTEQPTTTTAPPTSTTVVPSTTTVPQASTTTTAPPTTTTIPLPECLEPGEEDPRGPQEVPADGSVPVARPSIPRCGTPDFTG